MEVFSPDSQLLVIFGEVFSHPFGQGGDQHSLPALNTLVDATHKVVNLSFGRSHDNNGVRKPGGAYHLLYYHPACLLQLIRTGGGGDIDYLVEPLLILLKFKRSVVKG